MVLSVGVVYAENWWEMEETNIKHIMKSDDSISALDWENGYIDVKAFGAPNEKLTQSTAHAYSMALGTARSLAYEKLAEQIGKVRVDSDTTLENYLLKESIIRTQVHEVIEGAFESQEPVTSTFADGSWGVDVFMRLPLYGEKGIMPVVNDIIKRDEDADSRIRFNASPEVIKRVQGQFGEPVQPNSDNQPVARGAGFTGLIVDAGDTGLQPSMSPKIVTEDGREIYGYGIAKSSVVINWGMADYSPSVEHAVEELVDRIGKNPLIVKGTKVNGERKTEIVVSDEDALKIFAADMKDRFLEQCRVVLVTN
jgi:hypothetical protein